MVGDTNSSLHHYDELAARTGSSSAATRPYGSPSPDELETRRGCIAIRETHARLESSLKFRGGASLNTHASFLRGFELRKKGYPVASVGGKQERGAPLSRSHLALRRFGVGGGNLRDGGKRHVRYPTASYDLVLGGSALALGDRPQRQPTICASELCHARHHIADPSRFRGFGASGFLHWPQTVRKLDSAMCGRSLFAVSYRHICCRSPFSRP